jgi:hypothetical protein
VLNPRANLGWFGAGRQQWTSRWWRLRQHRLLSEQILRREARNTKECCASNRDVMRQSMNHL